MILYETLSLADSLVVARGRRKLNQAKAAKWFDCGKRTYEMWESGTRPLSVWLPKMQRFIGIPQGQLLKMWRAAR